MKLFILATLCFIPIGTAYGYQNCKETMHAAGKYYWYSSIISVTTILNDSREKRTWYINSNASICFTTTQAEISSPSAVNSGYLRALKSLAGDFTSENREKIKTITGRYFKDSNEFQKWLDINANRFFWSFEKNRITVLDDGFRCGKITVIDGKLYWFNYSFGAVRDMDTSPDKRLWSDSEDSTKCFITPLNEINDNGNILEGFKLAIKYAGNNETVKKEIIKKFDIITGSNRELRREIGVVK